MAVQQRGALQNSFLNRLRKSHTQTTIHLTNGVRLRGTIAAFDEFCIWLSTSGNQQLVFKHAISTIVPNRPIKLSLQGDDAGPEPDSQQEPDSRPEPERE